jgi:microsomal dipeptidase-like Zn-dependent dipeptidase
LGDVYTKTPRFGGLTSFGADVVRECNRLGILLDLAHANTETTAAALKTTNRPVIISHTGLDSRPGNDESMFRMMRPRLISKEQAKMVADAGGIIGVWTHLADTPLEYAQNIRALVDVIGVDHVCIGTDTKLTPSYHPPVDTRQKGPMGDPGDHHDGPPPGNAPNQPRIGERTNLAWRDQKNGFYYVVVDAMLKTGFTPEEIGKIGGGNFCRVFDTATAGH